MTSELMCHCGARLKVDQRHRGKSIRCPHCHALLKMSSRGAAGYSIQTTDVVKRQTNIFVSYRRDDSHLFTGRLVDRLNDHYGKEHVFLDIKSIPPGVDFRNRITNGIENCDVLLSIIGPRWAGVQNNDTRRLDHPKDYVRNEIETAFSNDVPIIPIFVDDTPVPKASELPDSIKDLVYVCGFAMDSDIDFHHHVKKLFHAIDSIVQQREIRASLEEPSRITIEVIDGPEVGRRYELKKGVITIGKKNCDIFVDNEDVSQRRARLTKKNGGYVFDFPSVSAGSYINDESWDGIEQTLFDGDRLRFGDTVLLYRIR